MTKGQRAMAVAMLYPEPSKAHRGKKAEKVLPDKSFSGALLSQARTVLAVVPEWSRIVRLHRDGGRRGARAERLTRASAERRAGAAIKLFLMRKSFLLARPMRRSTRLNGT